MLLESDITCFTSHRVLGVGYIAGLTVLTLCVTVLQAPDFSSLTCSRCAHSLFRTVLKTSYSQSIFKAGWLTNVSLLKDECFCNY